MEHKAINIREKLGIFSEIFSPRIIAQMNDYHFKLVKVKGEFVWHAHEETDEVFLVIDGELIIEFRDGEVEIKAGEMYVVPRGVVHKPRAERQCHIMTVEPAGTVNTGDTQSELTQQKEIWI